MRNRFVRGTAGLLVALVLVGCSGDASAAPPEFATVASYADELDAGITEVVAELGAWLRDAERDPADLRELAEAARAAVEGNVELPAEDELRGLTAEVNGSEVSGATVLEYLERARVEVTGLAAELDRVATPQTQPFGAHVLRALDDAWRDAADATSELRRVVTGADA